MSALICVLAIHCFFVSLQSETVKPKVIIRLFGLNKQNYQTFKHHISCYSVEYQSLFLFSDRAARGGTADHCYGRQFGHQGYVIL